MYIRLTKADAEKAGAGGARTAEAEAGASAAGTDQAEEGAAWREGEEELDERKEKADAT